MTTIKVTSPEAIRTALVNARLSFIPSCRIAFRHAAVFNMRRIAIRKSVSVDTFVNDEALTFEQF